MKNKYLVMALACSVSMSYAVRIGVLKAEKNYKCDEEVVIDLDVEDSNNDTGVKNHTDPNPPGISLGGHAVFTYCVIDDKQMYRTTYDFAVLSLDTDCPSGTHMFARHHDTEDSRNRNSHKGNISPNIVDKNATLFYCYVPRVASSRYKYPVAPVFGVFANQTGSHIAHSEIYIDDEDTHKYINGISCPVSIPFCKLTTHTSYNANEWYWYGSAKDYESNIHQIIDGSKNTTYHTIRWTGSSRDIFAKSADDAIEAPMAAMPTSAAIRGLDRSAITIELESAGDAKISVMNVNGAVVANIAQENLMPGVHQIKWNSGIVPNGLYIVRIVHNGLISSKSVILK